MSGVPTPEVLALAERRAAARADKDFAAADAMRDELAEAGWTVVDGAGGGWHLEAVVVGEPPALRASDVPSMLAERATDDISVHWVVEGWPDDVARSIASFRSHQGRRRVRYVVADVTGADSGAFGDDVEVISLEHDTGWGAAMNAGLRRATGRVVLAVDGSIEVAGDVFGPLELALTDPAVSAVVVFGADVNFLAYEPAFREAGKKMVFEGAGQDPFIVFPDADLDLALSDLVTAKFMYSGQTCTAPKRIFIHRSIYGEFLERFVERTARLVVGPPEDPRTEISPVASRLAVARIRGQLKEAVAMGARVVCGGTIEGNLIHPTVVRDATDVMSGMREEVFGPVAFTTPFDTKEEVVRRAKDHKYGLRAALFGGKEAEEAAGELAGEPYCRPVPAYTFGKFGTVALNRTRADSWKGAFVVKAVGGYGYSGWIWETVDGRFRIKQGPKLLSIETSVPEPGRGNDGFDL